MIKKVLLLVLVPFLLSISVNSQRQHSFHPDKVWPDNNGVHINAHGGGILFHDNTYYWYSEHKVEGKEDAFIFMADR